MFNEQDVANILCGLMDFDKEAGKRLNANKEQWITKKSTDEKIKSLMENHEIAADWEIEIADGIRSVQAKIVTVEFELNGKTASIRVNPETIIRKMVYKDYFSGYDFEIAKEGDELIKNLGAEKWCNGENALRCKHITKITYGKKDLYVRKQSLKCTFCWNSYVICIVYTIIQINGIIKGEVDQYVYGILECVRDNREFNS